MFTSHFYKISRHFIFILFLSIGFSANATEPAQAGYYWTGLGEEGFSPSEVASLMMPKISACASYELEGFGSPITSYKMTCYSSSGSKLIYTKSIVRYRCTSTSEFESCEADYEPPVEMCSDGFPADVYGYEDYCDRPTPKLCTDGSYIESTSFCPVTSSVCTDYDTCYNYAKSQTNCLSDSSLFTFNYQSPNAFDFACETIDSTSPDNPINGGNADGNEYNDPQSPEPPITSGDSDPSALAAAIGLELRSDFGNVERAVRDGISSAESNTDRTIEAINSAQTNLDASLSDIESAINDGSSADNGSSSVVDSVNDASSSITDSISQSSSNILDGISNSSDDVVSSVDGVNQSVVSGNVALYGQLSDISSKLDNLNSCDPNTDAQSCEGEHGLNGSFISSIIDAIQGTFDQESDDAIETVKGEIEDLKSNSSFSETLSTDELTSIWSFFLNIWPSPTECIPLAFGDGSQVWSITITCEFSDRFKAIFSFLISIYTILQLVDILFTGIRPITKTNN